MIVRTFKQVAASLSLLAMTKQDEPPLHRL
jgi:hypothetical protein